MKLPSDIEKTLSKEYEQGSTVRQMLSCGLMIDGTCLKAKEIKRWHEDNNLPFHSKHRPNKSMIEQPLTGDETLFCDTKFLESYFKKPIKKTKECR